MKTYRAIITPNKQAEATEANVSLKKMEVEFTVGDNYPYDGPTKFVQEMLKRIGLAHVTHVEFRGPIGQFSPLDEFNEAGRRAERAIRAARKLEQHSGPHMCVCGYGPTSQADLDEHTIAMAPLAPEGAHHQSR